MRLVERWLAILALCVLVPASVRANQEGDPATDAYRRGDYASARAQWLGRLEDPSVQADAERGRLCYNLGNVAFRSDAKLESVGWYSAARAYTPRDADLWTNLEFARSEAGLEPADRGDLAATARRVLGSLTLAEAEWLVLAAIALLGVALLYEALRGGRVARRLAGAAAVAVLLSFGPWLFVLWSSGADAWLVVAERGVTVHSEPQTAGAQIGKADAGATVERLDELPEWTRVRLDDGTEGWVESDDLFALGR